MRLCRAICLLVLATPGEGHDTKIKLFQLLLHSHQTYKMFAHPVGSKTEVYPCTQPSTAAWLRLWCNQLISQLEQLHAASALTEHFGSR